MATKHDQMESIEGRVIEDEHGNEFTCQLLPDKLIDLYTEVIINHPKLHDLLINLMKEDNYSPEIFFGSVAAYCDLVLDGNYSVDYLCEQLGNALINRREAAILSVNSIPTAPDLMRSIAEIKETSEEIVNANTMSNTKLQ